MCTDQDRFVRRGSELGSSGGGRVSGRAVSFCRAGDSTHPVRVESFAVDEDPQHVYHTVTLYPVVSEHTQRPLDLLQVGRRGTCTPGCSFERNTRMYNLPGFSASLRIASRHNRRMSVSRAPTRRPQLAEPLTMPTVEPGESL